MKKDNGTSPLVSEQCTEEEAAFISGQQVVPKSSSAVDNVVSVSPTLSQTLCQNLALPFTKSINLPESYSLCDTEDPVDQFPAPLYNKMAFSDCNPAYFSANGLLNRSVFGHSKFDLPNESVETEKNQKMILDVVYKEGKDIYMPLVSSMLEFFAAGGDKYIRKCPGGQTTNGGGGGGGAYGTTSNSGGYNTLWVTGYSGGGGGGYPSNGGGGDGDDDPWKNYPPTNLPRDHYAEVTFQAEDYLDPSTVDMLDNGDLFRELGLALDDLPPVELQLQPLPDQLARGNIEDRSDPMTPMTPCIPPITSPAQAPTQTSEVESLLQIQSLLMNPPPSVQMTIPQQPTSPGYANLPSAPVYNAQVLPPPSPIGQPIQQQQQQPSSSSDFFAITHCQNGRDHCIKMSIKNPRDLQAFEALKFSWNLYMKYITILKQDCTLPIATLGKAKLCGMKMDVHHSGLIFSMPSDCVSLKEWIRNNNDLRSCHLIIQQVLNTLVVLFQGENNLSFWGSFEVFVARNMQVYLYIDFNKSLSVQKVYACSGQSNSRIEDCRVLKELFDLLLLPYMTNSLVSPQLRNILSTFQQLLNAPTLQSSCVNQVATMARVLGERRMCCMQAQLYGYTGQYTIYSVEHEPVSQSLGILRNIVLSAGQKSCVVVHEDGTYVSVTEVSARHSHGHQQNYRYLLVSQDHAAQRIPGALYIE